jgi:hypothetical protein
MIDLFTSGKVIPEDLMKVMQKLNEVFPGNLVVRELDEEGATFYVRNLTDEVVIRTLMTQKPEIFGQDVEPGGAGLLEPARFQITSSLATQSEPGLTLRYLPNAQDGEYLAGFWNS